MAKEQAKEQPRERADKAAAHQDKAQAAEGFTAELPASFAAMIGDAEPETIAGWLQEHPTLRDPIFFSTQAVRGNTFAQTVLAIGPGAVMSAAPAVDPDAAKHAEMHKVAAWNQMSRGVIDAKHAPVAVRLPAHVVADLEQLWQKSIKGKEKGLEHGGNLVRTYGGREHIREQQATSADEFDGDEDERGWWDTIVANVHTHPEPNAPEHYSCFSDGDIQGFMEPGSGQKPMRILRSGPMTYMLAHTKQSRALVDGLFHGNRLDVDKKDAMMLDITAVYDATLNATPGTDGGPDPHPPPGHPNQHLAGPRWAEGTEAAVTAVCAKYGIAFYKGQGSDLQHVV